MVNLVVVDALKIRSQDPTQESARGYQWLTDSLIQVTHCNCCTNTILVQIVKVTV